MKYLVLNKCLSTFSVCTFEVLVPFLCIVHMWVGYFSCFLVCQYPGSVTTKNAGWWLQKFPANYSHNRRYKSWEQPYAGNYKECFTVDVGCSRLRQITRDYFELLVCPIDCFHHMSLHVTSFTKFMSGKNFFSLQMLFTHKVPKNK